MPQPAARLGDMHTCPLVDPVSGVPHVGGPVTAPGCPNVLVAGTPAACVGDTATCVGPPDAVVSGAFNVLIGNRPAARMGDPTAHGGVVVVGALNVLVG